MNKLFFIALCIMAVNHCYASKQDTYNVDDRGNVSRGAPKSFIVNSGFQEVNSRKPTRQEVIDHDPRQITSIFSW